VKRAVVTLAGLLWLAAAAPGPAQAGPPVPWCGPGASSVDRVPDAVLGYAVHVIYVRSLSSPDRFAAWAPRLAGDAAEIEAWWRSQDPTRSPRFDLFAVPGCAGSFGALDITSVQLSPGVANIDTAFVQLRNALEAYGFDEPEKAYLVYYDGPTGQVGDERVCGQGAEGSPTRPGIAVVYLDSCGADTGDTARSVIAVHELLHVFGAVSGGAPNHCDRGHVCDATNDLMTAILGDGALADLVLDADRDDYYGHAGAWADVQRSLFLERLDSVDRAAPTVPGALRVGDGPNGTTRVSWQASSDDVGPVRYRVYEDGRLARETLGTSLFVPDAGAVTRYAVRALDAVGHVSPPATARFRSGAGMVDEAGRLVRDTVRPSAVGRVTVTKTGATARLAWRAVRDAGGVRAYRVKVGSRTIVVQKPAIALARARVGGNVSIVAVDRAGNVGPAVVVPRARVR
jgi:hypothetical protein